MIEASREHLGWVLHESGPKSADHTVLLLPGALCTAAFYDDLLAEPSMSKTPDAKPTAGSTYMEDVTPRARLLRTPNRTILEAGAVARR